MEGARDVQQNFQRREAEEAHACFLDNAPLSLPHLLDISLCGFKRHKLTDVIRHIIRKNNGFRSPAIARKAISGAVVVSKRRAAGWEPSCTGSYSNTYLA